MLKLKSLTPMIILPIILMACSSTTTEEIDNIKPTLTLVTDIREFITQLSYIEIQGKVSDNLQVTDLTIQAEVKPSGHKEIIKANQQGNFTLKLPITNEENIITITVKDKNGNQIIQTGKVILDNTAPTLTIKQNLQNEISKTSQINVLGKVTDNIAVSKLSIINANNQSQIINLKANGEFETTVPLSIGDNQFTLIAKDKAGNETAQPIKIYFGQTLSAAGSHTGALINDKLYAWGRNNFGQVGMGEITTLRSKDNHPISPYLVENAPKNIVSIFFSQNYSTLLTKEGNVYTWGYDANGELGRGDDGRHDCAKKKQNCRLDIGKVSSLKNVIAINGGYGHLLTLTKSGEVWAFGSNDEGQIGQPKTIKNGSTPVKVHFPINQNVGKIIQIIGSADSSYALDDKGQVWAWGSNQYANLGQGKVCDKNNVNTSDCITHSHTPKLVSFKTDVKIIELAAGRDHVLALTDKGEVYGWGLNFSSQIGYNGDELPNNISAWDEIILEPTLLTWSKQRPAKHVYANGNTSYVMLHDNKIYPWGMFGETDANGDTDYPNLNEPTDKLPSLTNVQDMAVGALHQIAKRQDGGIFTWGWSFEGSLGGGKTVSNTWMYNVPIKIQTP